MKPHPNAYVDASVLRRIPLNHSVAVTETEPESRKFCRATVTRINARQAAVEFRDWSGDRFELRVELDVDLAVLTAPESTPRPCVDHLIRSVIRTTSDLLSNRVILE